MITVIYLLDTAKSILESGFYVKAFESCILSSGTVQVAQEENRHVT